MSKLKRVIKMDIADILAPYHQQKCKIIMLSTLTSVALASESWTCLEILRT